MGFSIDTKDFRRFARDLRSVDKEVAIGLRKGVVAGAEVVAEEAKAKASWSSRIPQTIKVRPKGSWAQVIAGGEDAPHAPAYENGGEPGTFRHPVHGNMSTWVSQEARPFLWPAAQERSSDVADLIYGSVEAGWWEVIT